MGESEEKRDGAVKVVFGCTARERGREAILLRRSKISFLVLTGTPRGLFFRGRSK